MSPDQPPSLSLEDRILAAELALGLHGRQAYDEAMKNNTAMREAIEAWENDLVEMTDTLPPRPPDLRLWQSLQAKITRPPSPFRRMVESLALWRLLAGGALAACLALLLLPRVNAPVPETPAVARTETPESILMVSLLPREGAALYLGVYRPQTRQLVMVAAQSEPIAGSGHHRLWMVPDDVGEPVDLGLMRLTGETLFTLDITLAAAMKPGSGLVVTLEPSEAPPPREARGDVLAHGKLRTF